jgi:hypothetical protein
MVCDRGWCVAGFVIEGGVCCMVCDRGWCVTGFVIENGVLQGL